MVRHLLVPIDGSDLSDRAVSAALSLAQQCGARVSFFHVQPSYYGRPDVAIYGEGLVLDPALSEQFNHPREGPGSGQRRWGGGQQRDLREPAGARGDS
jgi:nucleotide-binding universal stress UspA family protein